MGNLRDVIAGCMRARGVGFKEIPLSQPVKAPPPVDEDDDKDGGEATSPRTSDFYAGAIKTRDRMTAVQQVVRADRKARGEEEDDDA